MVDQTINTRSQLNEDLQLEVELTEQEIARSRRRRILLEPVYRRTHLGKRWPTGLARLRRPSFHELKAAYERISPILTKSRPAVARQTPSEMLIVKEIKRQTRRKFSTSVWIGNGNVDLFFANLAGSRHTHSFKGLAVEIDGGVHYEELKMRKDGHKYEMLQRLGIAVMSVPNGDVRHPLVGQIIKSLKTFRQLSTPEVRRVLEATYFETLICFLSDREFDKLFGLDGRFVLADLAAKDGL